MKRTVVFQTLFHRLENLYFNTYDKVLQMISTMLEVLLKFCKVHHFADDTNLLCLSNSIKKLNKLVNADLKHLVNWLNANKISLNVKKTEMVIFKSKQKKFEGDLKIKLCGKRLYPTESFKYLGVKIYTNLSWQYHVNVSLLS